MTERNNADKTQGHRFEPGNPHRFTSGNPGRPKGSRNKLGEAFIEALHDDFLANGPAVIETVRVEKPDQYLKVIASILPKQLEIKSDAFEGMSDDELAALVAAARSALGIADGERSSASTSH
jgi:hypothetical protein